MEFEKSEFWKFLSSNFILQLVLIGTDFYLLTVIDTELIGLWQYALLLQSYTLVLRLGIINAFNRAYPSNLAIENYAYARDIYSTTFYHIRLNVIVQFLFFLIAGFVSFFLFGNEVLGLTLLVMAVYAVFDSLTNFQEATLRNIGKLGVINNVKLFVSLVALISIVFPFYFGFNGFLIRVFCIVLASFSLMWFHTKMKWTTSLSWKVWKDLFDDGWKFWLWNYSKIVLKSTPRIYIVSIGNISVLGLYAPLNWIYLSFSIIAGSLNAYLYPILSAKSAIGETNLGLKTWKINLKIFLVLIPIVVFGCALLPNLVFFIPAYLEAVVPMQIMLVASLFDIFSINTTLWASRGEWKKILRHQLFSISITIITFLFVFLAPGGLLLNVSWAVLFTSIVNAFYLNISLLWESK